MRWRAWLLTLVLVVVVGSASLRFVTKAAHGGGRPVAAAYQLTTRFTGLTNDPVWALWRLSVAGNGKGLYAIFAVTNSSTNQFIRFKTIAVERRNGSDWQEFEPSGEGEEWKAVFGPPVLASTVPLPGRRACRQTPRGA